MGSAATQQGADDSVHGTPRGVRKRQPSPGAPSVHRTRSRLVGLKGCVRREIEETIEFGTMPQITIRNLGLLWNVTWNEVGSHWELHLFSSDSEVRSEEHERHRKQKRQVEQSKKVGKGTELIAFSTEEVQHERAVQ